MANGHTNALTDSKTNTDAYSDKHPFLRGDVTFEPRTLFTTLFMAAGAEIHAHFTKNLDDKMMHMEDKSKKCSRKRRACFQLEAILQL